MNKLLGLTAEVVGAYVASNPMPIAALPEFIASVNSALASLSGVPANAARSPSVNPKRSVFPDYIISLEDGRRFKSLKRHLMAQYGMTADEYRAKWNLPRDYPMVAPNYAAQRSDLAKQMGLGRLPKAVQPAKRKGGTGVKRPTGEAR
ncbi:MAG: MucR family transcriptional regulator [Hyphomicrobiales bacterium]|nr:MucR family transcriptional regulator [Hyphomicrobiales bacterium]